jgi:regulator of CtrA degradation
MLNPLPYTNEPIILGRKLADSPQFKAIFNEGMTLVEEVSAYLDGEGREEARILARNRAISYAAESMRLTTRLMQLASWLLLHRAINEGEMTREQAEREKGKVRLSGVGPATPRAILVELPADLQQFIEKTQQLYERIQHLNGLMAQQHLPQTDNNIALVDQRARLQRSFAASHLR